MIVGPVARAGATRTPLGALGQVSFTAPLTAHLYGEVRAFYVLLPSIQSPVAFAFPSLKTSGSTGGLVVMLGAGL